MAIEIKAPTFPESVQEGTLATWHKNVGDSVTRDELIVDIETDKVVLEVVAPATGTLTEILKAQDDIVLSNEVIARIEEGEAAQPAAAPAAKKEEADIQVAESLVNPAAKKLADERDIESFNQRQ
jgi:2-oxoglutarate dehydrogenase E2 component (dihydrolipoamide succinyltransferase)